MFQPKKEQGLSKTYFHLKWDQVNETKSKFAPYTISFPQVEPEMVDSFES